MRTLAIGDIHGCFTALTTLEREMAFTDQDFIITLGDYVDRGPDSKSVIDWLIARRRRRAGLAALQGNHELMMLWSRFDSVAQKSWMNSFVGGDATLHSYDTAERDARIVDVPDTHWDFIVNHTMRYHETETHIFVHASVKPELPMDQQSDETLFWERFSPRPLHSSGKPVICGHTAQPEGLPVQAPHGVCIDTRAHGGGWLTCLDVMTGEYGQANQRGEFRTGRLVEWCV
jgi:serine/threonine protein phosphatase 1